MSQSHDAIVIGSGAGGLTAALALARAGRRPIVLEQHYLPGGWCHSFDIGGYRFSPGVHYIGELAPGGRMRAIYEGLGIGGDLELCELNPDGYDHVVVEGERFDIPKGKAAFADRLKSRFPREAAGIDGYVDACDRIGRELGEAMEVRGLLDALTLPLRARTTLRWGLFSLQSMLDAHVKDPRLKAILAAQCGDHGLPPSLAPAVLHAAVSAHYFDGAYYPRGGGAAIPRAFVKALRRAGGDIRVRARVERILVERRNGRPRAIGVRLADGTEIRADIVISNADPQVTFGRLVDSEHQSAALRKRIARTKWSVSAISLFFAVDMDLRAAGMDSGNVWWYANPDLDSIYRLGTDPRVLDRDDVPGLFVTATTLKDPTKGALRRGHHTLEAFAFVPWEAFSRWASTRYGDRPADYEALKRTLKDRMLRAVGRVIPGIEKHVVFADLGTPLTNAHYVEASFGNLYGTEKTLFQVGPFTFPTRSEIDGLLLCGASTVGHGVFGATISGLAAAARALGCRARDLVNDRSGASIPIYPSEHPEAWPEAIRRRMGEAAMAHA